MFFKTFLDQCSEDMALLHWLKQREKKASIFTFFQGTPFALIFPNVKADWSSRGWVMFDIWHI